MRNFVQNGHTITIPAPAAVNSGEGVLIGALFGVASGTVVAGEDMDMKLVGVFGLPKVAAQAFAIGDVAYWDVSNKLVTRTATGNSKIGVAVSVAANPSATVNIRLVPTV